VNCILHTLQLGRARKEIEALGATAVVIGGGDAAMAARIAGITKSPWPFLSDAENRRSTLRALGFGRGILHLQESGTVIVDRDGRIAWRRGGIRPDASFDLGEVLGVLRRLAAATPPAAGA
jgi:peroxiredoxin